MDSCNNTNESQKHYVESKEIETEESICFIPLHETLEKTNLIHRNRNSVGCLGLGLGGLTKKVTMDISEVMELFYLDYGDGNMTTHIC